MLSKHLLSTKYLSEPVEFEKENVKLIVQFLSLILKYQIIWVPNPLISRSNQVKR